MPMKNDVAPMGPLDRAEAHLNTAIEEVGRILTAGARNNAETIKLRIEDALEEIKDARAIVTRIHVLESAVAQLQGFEARRKERELAALRDTAWDVGGHQSPGGEFATYDAPPAYGIGAPRLFVSEEARPAGLDESGNEIKAERTMTVADEIVERVSMGRDNALDVVHGWFDKVDRALAGLATPASSLPHIDAVVDRLPKERAERIASIRTEVSDTEWMAAGGLMSRHMEDCWLLLSEIDALEVKFSDVLALRTATTLLDSSEHLLIVQLDSLATRIAARLPAHQRGTT